MQLEQDIGVMPNRNQHKQRSQTMRNLTKYAVMIAMLIYTLPVYGATARDNYVYFPGVSYFKWYDTHHKITDGQPWNFIHSGMSDDSTGVIRIQAGRKGSEEVADWFRDRAAHAISTLTSPPSWPDKLNFVTYGHMILKDHHGRSAVCHNVVIGQGHTSTGFNNWWIGGKYMHRYGGKYWLVCPPLDEGYCGAVVLINPSQTRSNYLSFTLRMCPPTVSMSLSSDVLWPANGKMHEIEATITGGDACGESPYVELISLESNHPDIGLGPWDLEDDIQDHDIGTHDRVFRLRAEHSKDGGERVYTVTYFVIDGCGKETTLKATVTVPHDKVKNIRLKGKR